MVIVIEFMYLKEEYDPITYNTVHKEGGQGCITWVRYGDEGTS